MPNVELEREIYSEMTRILGLTGTHVFALGSQPVSEEQLAGILTWLRTLPSDIGEEAFGALVRDRSPSAGT